MTTEVVSDIPFVDPTNAIPYLELDEAIFGYRAQCAGLLDFSNPECYSGTGAVAAGATAKSLTNDQGVATAVTAWGAVTNGMLAFSAFTAGAGNRFTLPNTFKLPANCRRFVQLFWVKIPSTGFIAAVNYIALAGIMGNNGTLIQYGWQLKTEAGVPQLLNVTGPAAASAGGQNADFPTAQIANLCNGNLHQLAFEWDGSAGGTTASKYRVYMDKVLLTDTTRPYDNSDLVQPAQAPHLGYPGVAFGTAYAPGMSIGRPSVWNLTGTTIAAADIIAKDWDAAQGYLS